MIIEKSKLDESYPSSRFMLEGFAESFRRDRNANGGGILIFVREDIPCKQLKEHSSPEDIECIFLEQNFRKALMWNISPAMAYYITRPTCCRNRPNQTGQF